MVAMAASRSRAQMELLKLVKWPEGCSFSPFEPGDNTSEDPDLLLLQKVETLVLEIREERGRQPLRRTTPTTGQSLGM